MLKITEKIKKINKLKIILFLFIILSFFISMFNRFNCDEIEGIHTAWKIIHNGNIYIDFFQHHNPLSYYLWSGIIGIFGENIYILYIARFITFIMFLLILRIFYKISMKLFDNENMSLISTLSLFSLSNVSFWILQIRPDIGQILFSLLSFYSLLIYFDNKKLKNLIFSAIYIAVSFLFLQKAIFFMVILGGLFFYEIFILKNIKLKYAIIYLLVFVLSISPYFIYLIYNGFFEQYYIMNWTLNSRFLAYWYDNLFIKNLTISFSKDLFFWLFSIIGVFYLLKDKVKNGYFLIISSSYLLLSLIILKPHQYYFILPMMFISIIFSYGINKVILEKQLLNYIFIFIFLLTTFNFIFKGDHNFLQVSALKDLNSEKMVNKNDYVFDGFPGFNLFRNDINYFWFSVQKDHALDSYKKNINKNYSFDIYKSIEKYNPKIISIWYPFPSESNPSIMIDINNDYIKSHYKPLEESKFLYIRKDE